LPSRPWTGFRRDKSRRKLFAWWSMSSSRWTSRQPRRARASSKLCRKKKGNTFCANLRGAPRKIPERRNYATAIVSREKSIGASQTRDLLRAAAKLVSPLAGVMGERIPASGRSTPPSHPAALPPLRGILGPSPGSIWVCSAKPELRTEITRSGRLPCQRPARSPPGQQCSRTYRDFIVRRSPSTRSPLAPPPSLS
jgi:hypothetical protein